MASLWTVEALRRKGFRIEDHLGTAAPPATITLILPYPPSSWRLYTPVNSRLRLTHVARDYRTAAVQAARAQYRDSAPLHGRLKVAMVLHQPYEHGLDADNALKACWDSLTHAGIWHDDRQIDELHFTRVRHADHPRIVLTIERVP